MHTPKDRTLSGSALNALLERQCHINLNGQGFSMLNKHSRKDYFALESLLRPLGFEQTDDGIFEHELMEEVFDFTACSLHGSMMLIFQHGYTKGFSDCQTSIRKSLGIVE